jgi:hypothetical protein
MTGLPARDSLAVAHGDSMGQLPGGSVATRIRSWSSVARRSPRLGRAAREVDPRGPEVTAPAVDRACAGRRSREGSEILDIGVEDRRRRIYTNF